MCASLRNSFPVELLRPLFWFWSKLLSALLEYCLQQQLKGWVFSSLFNAKPLNEYTLSRFDGKFDVSILPKAFTLLSLLINYPSLKVKREWSIWMVNTCQLAWKLFLLELVSRWESNSVEVTRKFIDPFNWKSKIITTKSKSQQGLAPDTAWSTFCVSLFLVLSLMRAVPRQLLPACLRKMAATAPKFRVRREEKVRFLVFCFAFNTENQPMPEKWWLLR